MFDHLSPQELDAAYSEELTVERLSIAKMIALLCAMEKKRAYVDLGFTSMRALCIHKYKMSHDEAKARLAISRLAKRFPQVLEALRRRW